MVIPVHSQRFGGCEQACVWMNAGLLAYRLCNRDFDCDHCPLDAALRGDPRAAVRGSDAPRGRASGGVAFPGDRVYSRGHTWLQALGADGRRFRFGVDGFAACVIGAPRALTGTPTSRPLDRAELLCTLWLDEGQLALGAPVVARVGAWNPALAADPGAIAADPYGDGWILELAAFSTEEVDALLPSHAAQRQAVLDLRRFRRRVALELLSERAGPARRDPDGGQATTNVRELLDPDRFLEVVRELVH